MAESEELDRLKRRLTWEGAEPLAQLSRRATHALMARGEEFISWVREMTEEWPLISLWVAFQIGFAVGRWGPHRAKP
jgi:hypothetical protein